MLLSTVLNKQKNKKINTRGPKLIKGAGVAELVQHALPWQTAFGPPWEESEFSRAEGDGVREQMLCAACSPSNLADFPVEICVGVNDVSCSISSPL